MRAESALVRQTQEEYGREFSSHLFDQYQHYVESAEKISERRVSANKYYLSVNSALIALYGFLISAYSHNIGISFLLIAGIIFSVIWLINIRSYRDINSVKFKVIHKLEEYMPACLYDYEWQVAELGKGKTYIPTSHIERWTPIVFGLLYLILLTLQHYSFLWLVYTQLKNSLF